MLKDAAQLVSLLLVPGVWWAATVTSKLDRLHKAHSRLQVIENKIAVLEERTGGPVVVR